MTALFTADELSLLFHYLADKYEKKKNKKFVAKLRGLIFEPLPRNRKIPNTEQ